MSPIQVDRRSFLKGLGAAAGLGTAFLTSPVAMGQTDEAPLRVLLVALQHGWGASAGATSMFGGSEFNFTFPEHLQALDAIKGQCVVIDGARGTGWGNAHDVSYSDIFTASVPWGEGGSTQLGSHFPEPMGPSIDHVIGQHHNKPVLRVSANYRSWGKQFHPLCFDENAQQLDSFFRPLDAYNAIVGPIKMNAQPPQPGREAIRANLFDALGRDTDRLLGRVSGTERLKLEGYLGAVNDLSERLNRQSQLVISLDDIPDAPEQSPEFQAALAHYFDLIHLVFQADTHRVSVLGLGQGVDDWTWRDKNGMVQTGNPWGSDFHHEVAHYGNEEADPDLGSLRSYRGWVDWYTQQIVGFAQRLAATPDVDGRTLLDNTVIVLTGEVGTGQHDTRSKTHILIGGGDRLRRGRLIFPPRVEPRMRDGIFLGGQDRQGNDVVSGVNYGSPYSIIHTADVLAAIGRLAGLPLDSFGLEANNRSPYKLDLTT